MNSLNIENWKPAEDFQGIIALVKFRKFILLKIFLIHRDLNEEWDYSTNPKK
jgi:hypothetical protein